MSLEQFRVAVTDDARQPLMARIRDLEAQLRLLRSDPPPPDEEDWTLIAEQMIDFCQGIAAPEDIEDIRTALSALGMSRRNCDRVMYSMRHMPIPAELNA